ncbi:hypothetical protein HNP48_002009 [Acidovorax soli]|uniref:Uncharacterized protein n=1 Tax=Acidovorax soli TaxID=592050 RepID=A0A7X0PD31_9BURK|nr:hypothetical protein [Acidovorax soli]MBB6559342.1 hypothetical protein [Acidovorax soli]
MGRAGTNGELKLLTGIMAGDTSAAELVVMAANLDLNPIRINLVGLATKGWSLFNLVVCGRRDTRAQAA